MPKPKPQKCDDKKLKNGIIAKTPKTLAGFMKPPQTLYIRNLIEPILKAQNKINELQTDATKNNYSELLLEGQFVLLVAKFENVINNIIFELLYSIPDKIPEEHFKLTKNDLIYFDTSILTKPAELYMQKISYKNSRDFFEDFINITSLDRNKFDEDDIELFYEIKESRNLLLHNDLVVNELYIRKAGKFIRTIRKNDKLHITLDYFVNSSKITNKILDSIKSQINLKFSKYTRFNNLKKAWNYLFNSPILQFDDYWSEHKIDDTIILKNPNFHPNICSSEKIFLGVWLNHYNGSGSEYLSELNIHRLDSENRMKLIWLLNFFNSIYFK